MTLLAGVSSYIHNEKTAPYFLCVCCDALIQEGIGEAHLSRNIRHNSSQFTMICDATYSNQIICLHNSLPSIINNTLQAPK